MHAKQSKFTGEETVPLYEIEHGMKAHNGNTTWPFDDYTYKQSHRESATSIKHAMKSAEIYLRSLASESQEFAAVQESEWINTDIGSQTWCKVHHDKKYLWYVSVCYVKLPRTIPSDGEFDIDQPRFRTEYRVCPNCGEQDLREQIDTVPDKWECRNCDYYEEF